MTLALLRRDKGKRARRSWTNTVAATGWAESTQAEVQWGRSRGAALRWAIAGALVGLVIGVIAFAPAAWLANAVASATDAQLRERAADAVRQALELLLDATNAAVGAGHTTPM